MISLSLYLVVGLIYAVYLFVPGFLILKALGIERHVFLLAYAFSFSLLILSQIPARVVGNTIVSWIAVIHVITALLVLISYYLKNKQCRPKFGRLTKKRAVVWVGLIFIIVTFCIYHVIAGPYTEIPSDFWKHTARVGMELDRLSNGQILKSNLAHLLFFTGENYVYFLHAVTAWILRKEPLSLVSPVTLVSSCFFLGSIYWFSIRLFAGQKISTNAKVTTSVLATILTFFWLGTATFSYIRYYGYFPAIFNLPLFYASIALFLDYLERPREKWIKLIPIPLFILTMGLVHKQEAVFTLVMIAGISIWRTIRCHITYSTIPRNLYFRANVFSAASLLVILGFFLYAILDREMANWGFTPHVVSTKTLLPFLGNFPIANPSFRFWDTLAIFGLLVYIWFIVKGTAIRKVDFITVGMASPFFTHFNPFYAYLFLHFGNSSGLWRTAYLMPIPFVAALMLVMIFSHARKAPSVKNILYATTVTIALSIALLPINFAGYVNRTSRFYSLLPVESQSGALLWQDLIEAVINIENQYKIRAIYTDEVTRFVVYSATRNQILSWLDKFTSHEYFPKYRSTYRRDFLTSDLTNHLLIINRRNGVKTGNALYSHHWPENILNVSRHYPDDLEIFVEKYPENFELLWSENNISIYLCKTFN